MKPTIDVDAGKRKTEAGEGSATVRKRWVSRFSWSQVDPTVVRRLLATVYGDKTPAVKGMSRDNLAELAERCFGSPPRAEWVEDMIGDLLKVWLPRADVETVGRLTEMVKAGLGPAGRVDLATKSQMIEFLNARNRTRALKHNVRAEFIRAHRQRSQETVRTSIKDKAPGPIELVGQAIDDRHVPYPHQLEARRRLDAILTDDRPRAGLIVLPTGAGKTETIIDWLLNRLEENPDTRVLWLAHQQELLEQAMRRFEQRAAARPEGFNCRARLVYAGASSFATLGETSLRVAAVTVQTAGARFDKVKEKVLRAFTERPTYVVVDEAHHAGSAMYEKVLDVVAPRAEFLIGLTATPWPSGAAAGRLHRTFPVRFIEVGDEELIKAGILARPVLHSIETGQTVLLDDEELHQAGFADLPPSVLAQLQNDVRDHLVVSTWVQHRRMWGKSLVFATRIEHADSLAQAFEVAGAPVRVIHSRMEGSRAEALDWFRTATTEVVLVSVGMLTEGIDLPDANAAFLARPTTSRILLRQMIGRVLRGPKANGGPEAHIVDFRDRWENFADIVEPDEVLEVEEVDPTDRERARRLPEILADDGNTPIPDDVAAQVRRAARAVRILIGKSGRGAPLIDPLLVTSRLAGWYELPGRRVAVFEHQQQGFRELLDVARLDLSGVPFLSYFEDGHPPYPSQASLRELVDHVREWDEIPTFVAVEASLGPQTTAAVLFDAGPLHDWERSDLIRESWERTLIRAAYPNPETFEIAVERELRQLRLKRTGRPERFDPEGRRVKPSQQGRRRLPRTERWLNPAVDVAVKRVRTLLPPDVASRLNVPTVEWTARVVSSTLGHWSIKLTGKNKGKQIIRINSLLRTDHEIVSDEMLGYLVYHELLHHLLPGMGHDAEFRDYESRWPDSVTIDAAFDTLHEKWHTDPERYNNR